MDYIAYYRVSTDRQGKSGLGLDAQRAAVAAYIGERGQLATEYTEIESGKRDDRPQLAAALAECRKRRALLIIAKLDRLARSVHFISGLMESGVEFVAVDMPQANRFMLHIHAAVAEYEREQISKRTTDALAAAKARGQRLGNPRPAASLTRGRATAAAQLDTHRASVAPVVAELHGQGLNLSQIARELNRRSIQTARGRQWEAATVKGVLSRSGL